MSFAYWASSIAAPNGSNGSEEISLGDWYDGIPIFTVDEFVDMITTNNNTQSFVLARDLDFEGITPVLWTSDDSRIFSGSFDGNGKSLNNIDLVDFRGVFSILEGATVKNLTLNSVNINYTVSNSTTSGILAGRLQGNGNLIDGIQIIDSSVSNISVLAGGLFGFASPLSGTGDAVIANIDIVNTTISGGFANAIYGNGGLIGSVNNFEITFDNISANVFVTSPNALNSGGIVGATLGASVLNMTNVNVVDSEISINSTGITLGAGGAVGYLVGTGHTFNGVNITNSTIASASLSGGIIGHANQASGTLSINNANVINSTISSSVAGTTSGNGGAIGVVNGYNTSISNLTISSQVTSTGAANAGGVVGVAVNSSRLTMENVTIEDSTIQINGTGTALGAGGVVGLMQSTLHSFLKIRVSNSTVTSSSATGGVIGFANQGSASATYNNIKVTGSNISITLANATISAGGVIGNITGFTSTLNDVYVESVIQSTNANVGGVIGYTANGSNTTINRAVVFSSVIINSPANNTDRGAGGMIGRNAGTATANDTFFSGYLKARIAQSRPYVGVLRAIGNNVTNNGNSRSAEIRYFVSNANPEQLVNTATFYNNMRGQKLAYASTYTELRTSLNVTYWTTNFSTITNSSLWSYNSTTRLYELIT